MFIKYQAVFQNRWRAVIWASGILLTAYCTVPSDGEDDPMVSMVTAVAGHPASEAPAKPADPWALDKK